MARLWEDGFDHYGTGATANARMLDGSYGQADYGGSGNGISIVNNIFNTGNACMQATGGTGLFGFQGLRWVLPSSTTKIGAAAHLYFGQLPNTLYSCPVFDFLSADPQMSQVGFYVDPNGCIRVVRAAATYQNDGNGFDTRSYSGGTTCGVQIAQSDPIIVASAWNHVEVQLYVHPSLGWVRVAVNGVHRFEATDLNTQADTSGVCSVGQWRPYINASTQWYMDDYYIYDFTLDSAVDTNFCPPTDGDGKATGYIGRLQAWPLFPNADTAQADWGKSTGTDGFALIDEHTPNDADYVYSTAANDLSEFDLDDLPPEITYIRGLGIHARLSQADSGAAMTKVGMKSVAATSDAPERPITQLPTYWTDQINVDPNSSARWTRDSLNAAKLRITRSL